MPKSANQTPQKTTNSNIRLLLQLLLSQQEEIIKFFKTKQPDIKIESFYHLLFLLKAKSGKTLYETFSLVIAKLSAEKQAKYKFSLYLLAIEAILNKPEKTLISNIPAILLSTVTKSQMQHCLAPVNEAELNESDIMLYNDLQKITTEINLEKLIDLLIQHKKQLNLLLITDQTKQKVMHSNSTMDIVIYNLGCCLAGLQHRKLLKAGPHFYEYPAIRNTHFKIPTINQKQIVECLQGITSDQLKTEKDKKLYRRLSRAKYLSLRDISWLCLRLSRNRKLLTEEGMSLVLDSKDPLDLAIYNIGRELVSKPEHKLTLQRIEQFEQLAKLSSPRRTTAHRFSAGLPERPKPFCDIVRPRASSAA